MSARPWRSYHPKILAAAAVITLAGGAAHGERSRDVGGFLGPRIFSQADALGTSDQANGTIRTPVLLGARIREGLLPWLSVEAELPIAIATIRSVDADVFFADPRLTAQFHPWRLQQVTPLLTVGAGAPFTLSSKRSVYATDIQWETILGAGAQFEPDQRLRLRAEIRVAIVPARGDQAITADVELLLGVSWRLGVSPAELVRRPIEPIDTDRDNDGIDNELDRCPDLPEDVDGVEDNDGCPDIDDDFDTVLDIVDQCPREPETYNGYEDDDGCPDILPDAVAALQGPLEGIAFDAGRARPIVSRRKVLEQIAKTLKENPSVRLRIIGHADLSEGIEDHDALSRERAEAVRKLLMAAGVREWRLQTLGKGTSEPADESGSRRSRLANRRIELQVLVPIR